MKEEHKTGAEGEAETVKYLLSQGYEVLATNWRFGQEEIDIIARTKHFLVIVEVKTRSSKAFGEPEAFVNRQKQKHLIKAAGAYLEKTGLDLEVRFDIASVMKQGDFYKVTLIQNAFYPLLSKS
ncbi:MAG TPA: YraN family protein [Bacteroidia bacterium]|jgi:putative endonuclease|nr:YraN family protein [Bacteroidia bacterium]